MKPFRDLPVKYKLLSSFLVIGVITIIFGTYLNYALEKNDQSLIELAQKNEELTNYIKLEIENKEMNYAVRNFILTQDHLWEKNYDAHSAEFDHYFDRLKKVEIYSDEEKELNEVEELGGKIKGTELLVLSYARDNKTEKAKKLFDAVYYEQQTKLVKLINGLVSGESDRITKIALNAVEVSDSLQLLILFLLVATFSMILVISIVVSTIFSNPIKKLAEAARKISEGDLEARAEVSSKDEVGKLAESFNEMASKLKGSYEGLGRQVKDRTRILNEKFEELERFTKLSVGRELKMIELKKRIGELEEQVKNEKAKGVQNENNN